MTYKSKFIISMVIVLTLIFGAVFMLFKNSEVIPDKQEVKLAPVKFLDGTDNFGNPYTVEYYPEEGFCVLSVYMEESKTHSWIWSDLTNEIECNYIHYQDDHYVVSYKANEDYVGFCQSAIMLSPIEDTHDHTKDSITEYNSYIIEITVAEDGNHVFNVYPATVSDEYVTELDDEVSTEEYSTESTTE